MLRSTQGVTMLFKLIELALLAGVGTYVWKRLIRHWARTGKRLELPR